MQLIDCFSDIFTFTLNFLQRQGGGELAELRPGLLERYAPPVPAMAGKGRFQTLSPAPPATAAGGAAPAPFAGSAAQGANTPQGGTLADLLTPPTLKPLTATEAEPAAKEQEFTFEAVRDTYKRLLGFSRELCLRGNYAREDYELAKFAVCAWVDEKISASAWPEKIKWPKAELQRQYFNTTNAGEEFYQKLCALQPSQVEVMEVFANCLALGFHGSYYQPSTSEELAGIRLAACRAVLGYSPEQDAAGSRKLFPGAYPTGRERESVGWGAEGRGKRWGKLASGVCCVLLPVSVFVLMYLAYHGLLQRLLTQFSGSL